MSEKIFNKYKKIWGAFWLFVLVLSNIFITLPETVSAANPKSEWAGTGFTQINYGSEKYYLVGSANSVGRELNSSREVETGSTGKRGSDGPGTYLFFAYSKALWDTKTPANSCGITPEETTAKYIRVLQSDYLQARDAGKALITGQNLSWSNHNLCITGRNDLGAVDIENKSFSSTQYLFTWDYGNSLESFSNVTAKIKQTKPVNDTYLYNNTLSSIGSVYTNFGQTQAIEIIPTPLLPVSTGSLKSLSGGTLGPVIQTVKLIDPNNLASSCDISGKLFWGGIAGGDSNLEGYSGDAIEVSLWQGTTDINKRVRVDTTTGTYKILDVPVGDYKVKVDFDAGDAFFDWVESAFGAFDRTETRVTGETDIKIDGTCIITNTDIAIGTEEVKKEGVIDSWFDTAMNSAMEYTVKALNVAIGAMMTIVMEAVEGGNEVAQINGIREVIKGVRNLALGLLTLGLLIIAFANIIGIDIEKYGVNRMIPRMVIAVIGVFFSLLICQALLETSTALTKMLLTTTNTDLSSISEVRDKTATMINGITDQITQTNNFQILFIILLLLGLLLVCIWLGIILIVRKIMIMFLVCVAPAAFIMSIMPFTEKLYKDWWKRFLTWAFMGPAIAFFIAVGNEFLLRGFVTEKFAPSGIDLLSVDEWSFLILTAVCWGIAAFVPLTLGKEIYGKITAPAKKLAGAGLKMAGISDAMGIRKSNIAQRQKARGFGLANKVAQSKWGQKNPFLRQMITGADDKQVSQMGNTAINERMKEIETMNMPKKDAQAYWKNSTGPERLAAGRFLASKGWYEDGNQGDYAEIAKDMDDPIIAAHVAKEQPELLAGLASSHLLYGTPISSQPQRTPAGGGTPVSRVDFEKEAAKAIGKAFGKIEDLTHHQTSLLQRTTEGQTKLNGLISNQEKVKALNEKGKDRTVAAIGKYIERLEAATPGTIDRMSAGDPTGQHKRVLEDIVRRYHEYQSGNPTDPNPDHEIS